MLTSSPAGPVLDYSFDLLPDCLAALRSKMRIAVVYSGSPDDPETVLRRTHNPRSWKSYEAVARDIAATLEELGFQHVDLIADGMQLPARLRQAGTHLVWLNTGGVQGYDPVSHTPGMLEMLGIPYVGHDPHNSSVLDNKHTFKYQLSVLGIPTAPFVVWNGANGLLLPRRDARFAAVFGGHAGPFVVKPVSGRGSVRVSVVESLDRLPDVCGQLYHETHDSVLIEKYLPGREFCVAVSGPVSYARGGFTRRTQPNVFSLLERVLAEDEPIFESMDRRPITAERARPLDPDDPLAERLVEVARRIYTDFQLRSIVRVDLRADEAGDLHVLEANPKPDLKRPGVGETSLISIGIASSGMTYPDLILSLLADRLDYLLTHQRAAIGHLLELLR